MFVQVAQAVASTSRLHPAAEGAQLEDTDYRCKRQRLPIEEMKSAVG